MTFFSYYSIYSQSSFIRKWGTMMQNPIFGSNFVVAVNPINGNLYYVKNYLEIIEHNINSPQEKSIYKIIPRSGGAIIQFITFDSKGNIIITARDPAPLMLKINLQGTVLFSLRPGSFSQNTTHITLDKFDNIYFIQRINKNNVLTGNPFQNTGDQSSIINEQDVITKLDKDGKHVWSTFYTKDHSYIRSIVAGDDGLYVYGEHMASNSKSNYFGTPDSFQEYATGLETGVGNNAKNVFLSKFNFNGAREWSTYFAIDRSLIPYSEVLNYYGGLTVINNEPYILTKHEIRPIMSRNPTTSGAFLTQQVSDSQFDITVSKFSSKGKREWTTFVYDGEAINRSYDTNELYISGTTISSNTFMPSLTTNDGYQKSFGGGRTDSYSFSLSPDGKNMNYSTLYGFTGTDFGVTIPTFKGYYTIGYSFINPSENSPFVTDDASYKTLLLRPGIAGYYGSYISYFMKKSLGTSDNYNLKNISFSVFPNPTVDILNIRSTEILPEGTLFRIYDVVGKTVLIEKTKAVEVNQINVSMLNTGTYILQITNASSNKSFKFIKK